MDDPLTLPTSELLDELARPGRGAGAGPAAALVAGAAAALVAKAARSSPEWRDGPAAAAQAEALRARVAPLGRADAEAYAAAVAGLDGSTEPHAGRRDFRLGRALAAAADVPLRIAAAAADVAELASLVAAECDPDLRPEAIGAVFLAEGAARAAAHLVEVNLALVESDERVAQARAYAAAAAAAVRL